MAKVTKIKKSRFIPRRSFILLALCVLVFGAIISRLFYLQVVSYDYYHNKVVHNVQKRTTVKADRGIIYDANGLKLATNYTVYRVFVSPKAITDAGTQSIVATGLRDIIGADYENVMYNITNFSNKADRTIKRNVEEEDADKLRAFIAEHDLESQIYLEASSKRYYPYSTLASHVIGFCGTDGGLLGLELKYDNYLTGNAGTYITAKDAQGHAMSTKYETFIETEDGCDLITTIDARLQSILENQLRATFEESTPLNRVTGICIDVNTSAVLAMATYPDFDLNSPYTLDKYSLDTVNALGYHESSEEYKTALSTATFTMWRNKAVSDLYEPGSTFKIITTAMAREENVVQWEEPFKCTGVHVVAGTKIRCHRIWGHGTQSYARQLQQSCNPTLMTIADRIGREKFYEYFQAFGYSEKTGIDLPGESNPIYSPYSSFNTLELAVYSFGQTFKVTPIQQITAISAVANGGYLNTPYVVDKIVDGNGNIVMSRESTVKRQVISTEICNQITEILEQGVSTDGGAKNAYVAGYKIAAKTGTSEVRDELNEEGESIYRVGSCIGYAPADDPQIAVLIVVDKPQCENIFGAYVAAPYVASFMSEALPYIGVERNLTPEEEANLSTTLRNYVGLTVTEVATDLTNRGIKFTVYGTGEEVTYQIPAGGASINKATGKVYIYSGDARPDEKATVPDVMGRTAERAKQAIIGQGLNIVLEGATNLNAGQGAVVVSQTPAAGTQVDYGTVVTVVMRHIGDTDA